MSRIEYFYLNVFIYIKLLCLYLSCALIHLSLQTVICFAMDTFKSLAQEIIPCDLCNNATQYFCNSCQNNLCVDCISKHISKFQSLSHRIVTFSERKIQLVLPACLEHHGERCESYCKKCDVPVCLMCISKSPHKRHNVENLIKYIDLRKRVI